MSLIKKYFYWHKCYLFFTIKCMTSCLKNASKDILSGLAYCLRKTLINLRPFYDIEQTAEKNIAICQPSGWDELIWLLFSVSLCFTNFTIVCSKIFSIHILINYSILINNPLFKWCPLKSMYDFQDLSVETSF